MPIYNRCASFVIGSGLICNICLNKVGMVVIFEICSEIGSCEYLNINGYLYKRMETQGGEEPWIKL